MKCLTFYVLIVFCVECNLKIYALDCSQLPHDYWCINNVSATLCEVLAECQTIWRNAETRTDVGEPEKLDLTLSSAEAFRKWGFRFIDKPSDMRKLSEDFLTRIKDWLPKSMTNATDAFLENSEQGPKHQTGLNPPIGDIVKSTDQDELESSINSYENLNDTGTEPSNKTELLKKWGFHFIKQPSDMDQASEIFFMRLSGLPQTSVMRNKKQNTSLNIRSDEGLVQISNGTSSNAVPHLTFNNSVIILTSVVGFLASTWNVSGTMARRNNISVYYHCPECEPGDDLIILEAGHMEFFTSMTGVSKFIETRLQSTTYRLMIPRNPIYSMLLPCFRAEIRRDGQVVHTAVSVNTSNWMEQLRPSIEYMAISDLVIPGTHQSGSYVPSKMGVSSLIKAVARKWTLCQDATIFEQLYNGIRYLDIRASCLKRRNQCRHYYVDHGGIYMISLQSVVEQLNYFLDITQEIVIMSIKEFSKGFDSDADHDAFIKDLHRKFASHLFLPAWNTWDLKLSELWTRNKRLIISYSHNRHHHGNLWPPIKQHWCDKRNITELHDCLHESHRRRSLGSPSADMVQLTHDWTTVVADIMPWTKDNSVRSWANELSPYIPKWYNEEWNSTANIIAVDFFEVTGIVELAIHLNQRRIREGTLRTKSRFSI